MIQFQTDYSENLSHSRLSMVVEFMLFLGRQIIQVEW